MYAADCQIDPAVYDSGEKIAHSGVVLARPSVHNGVVLTRWPPPGPDPKNAPDRVGECGPGRRPWETRGFGAPLRRGVPYSAATVSPASLPMEVAQPIEMPAMGVWYWAIKRPPQQLPVA